MLKNLLKMCRAVYDNLTKDGSLVASIDATPLYPYIPISQKNMDILLNVLCRYMKGGGLLNTYFLRTDIPVESLIITGVRKPMNGVASGRI